MNTIEQAGYVQHLLNNLYGMVLNLRDNAKNYQSRKALPIKGEILADATQFHRRLDWILLNDRAALQEACLARGIDVDEVLNLANSLRAVVNNIQAATLDTPADVDTAAAAILSTVPDFKRPYVSPVAETKA